MLRRRVDPNPVLVREEIASASSDTGLDSELIQVLGVRRRRVDPKPVLVWEEDDSVADVLARALEEEVVVPVPRAMYPAAAPVANAENKLGPEGCLCGVGLGGIGIGGGGEGDSSPGGGGGGVGRPGDSAISRMSQTTKARAMSPDTERVAFSLASAAARGEVLVVVVVAGAGCCCRAWCSWLRASRSTSRASRGCFVLPSLVRASWYSTPQLPLRM